MKFMVQSVVSKQVVKQAMLAGLSALLWPLAALSQWTSPEPGVETAKWQYEKVQFDVIRFEQGRFDIRVIDVQQALTQPEQYKRAAAQGREALMAAAAYKASNTTIAASGRAVQTYLSFSLEEINRLLKPLAAINGGMTGSYSFPVPVGLLVIGGQQIKPANRDSKSMTGVFCVTKQNEPAIFSIAEYRDGTCAYALQSGPRVVEPGSIIGITAKEKLSDQLFERSIVAVDSAKRLWFVRTSSSSLRTIAESLTDEKALKSKVYAALNLSGTAESGMLLNGKTKLQIGNHETLLATAIGVFPRR